MLIPKVLVVDDDAVGPMSLESLLVHSACENGYEIVTVGSGEEALRLSLQSEIALILVCVKLPNMAGFETAEAIHAHPRSTSVPIIFVGEQIVYETDRLRGYQKGAVDYLFTPLIPHVLHTKVAVFVELSKKNLQLQRKADELAQLNQELRVETMQDLQWLNAELDAEVAVRKKAEQREHELAIRDPLTGLLNRRSLMDHLEHALANAARRKEQIAILFLDLDKFKSVNDTLGHDVGDDLLREVSKRLLAAVRESDVVARLGGDEFVVVLDGLSSPSLASTVARKIAASNTKVYQIGPHAIQTSSSIGIGMYPQDGSSIQELMNCADQAMYHAKQNQRGSVEFFREEMNLREVERSRCESELQLAFDRLELEIYYQPRVDMGSGRVVCVEALLRWNHPRLGLMDSDKLLTIAASCGKLFALCEWFMEAACFQMNEWRETHSPLAHLSLAIHVPMQQIDANFAHAFLRHVRRFKLRPSSLQLAIGESQLQKDQGKLLDVLRVIREAGVCLAVDGFGTNCLALALVKTLPLNVLKIDVSLVQGLGSDPCDYVVVESIIKIARALGMRVVADGVETHAQQNLLKNLGCDEHQGALAGMPLPAKALEKNLNYLASVIERMTDNPAQPN